MRTTVLALAAVCLLAGQPGQPALAAAPAEKEVLAAMDAWKQAMVTKDRAGLDKLLHADLSYGHSSGVVENKAEAIQHVVGNAGTYVSITFADTKVRVRGTTALVTGKADYDE